MRPAFGRRKPLRCASRKVWVSSQERWADLEPEEGVERVASLVKAHRVWLIEALKRGRQAIGVISDRIRVSAEREDGWERTLGSLSLLEEDEGVGQGLRSCPCAPWGR